MTSTFEYSKINENSSSELGNVTLRQGLKFKKSQDNKTKKIEKKNLLFEGFQGFQGNLDEGPVSASKQAIIKTNQLISQTDNTVTSQVKQLEALQNKFNTILQQYNQSNTNLIKGVNNYIQTPTTSKKKTFQNVYVNKMVNGAVANYVNTYNDNTSAPVATMLGNNYTFNSCKTAAEDKGYQFFGLENVDLQSQTASCGVSNSQGDLSKYGAYVPRCNKGSDGNMYGGGWTNAIYSTSGNYIGCYGDGPERAMTFSGADMSKYNSVYVCGPFGIGPWGGSNFPDPTAQWIWYTPNAQNDAPDNTNAPVNIIYQYNYSGSSYLPATIYGMCDNGSTVYLNSQKIGNINGGWGGPGISIPINLAPGVNTIVVAAFNQGGPAGLVLTVVNQSGQVLFNTNANWKYTSESIANLANGAQIFSVDSCKSYAINNGYTYFGLQNGTKGNSQCFVSNDLNTSTGKYGSVNGSTKLNDGQMYGIKNSISVYELNKVGISSDMGKVGYLDETSNLAEYPQSMYTIDPTTQMPIIKNSSGCPKSVTGIDTLEWEDYPKTGVSMSMSSVCGLQKAVQDDTISNEALRMQLASIADEIVNKITYLESLNLNLNNQMGIDRTVLDQNLKKYQALSKQYHQYKTVDEANINGILSDSDIVVLQENYGYLFWSILAIAVVVITVNTIKNK